MDSKNNPREVPEAAVSASPASWGKRRQDWILGSWIAGTFQIIVAFLHTQFTYTHYTGSLGSRHNKLTPTQQGKQGGRVDRANTAYHQSTWQRLGLRI